MKMLMPVLLVCGIALLLLATGCSQPSQQTPTPVPTTVPTEAPTTVPTPLPTTPAPVPTTIAPAVPLPTVIKDSPLLFTISAPGGYTGTTIRLKTSDYSIAYKTTIFNPATSGTNITVDDNSGRYSELPDSLTIFSYSTSYSVDQDIRDIIRGSGAALNESTVAYTDITYTRFDVASDPYSGVPDETVIFVGDKSSANENGFLPVMIYTITPGGTLSKASYENMVKSFAYYTGSRIGTASGIETDRPPFYQ
jgi:hypothetical protein